MRLDLNQLPNDVDLLQRLVRDLSAHLQHINEDLRTKSDVLQQSQQELKHKAARIEHLEHQLAVLRSWRFGRSSEKFNKDQLCLWQSELEADQAELQRALEHEHSQGEAAKPREEKAKEKAKPKRNPLPAHLPREHHHHELAACECCGGALTEIGEEVVEQLDYRPASFFVHRHTKKKYACGHCESAVSAPLPAQPIEKGLPGCGLLGHIIVAKYCDHQPLYRQSEAYAREQVPIPRSTMNGWLGESGWLLKPIVEAMKRGLLSDTVLHTDDTIVPVLEPGRGSTRDGRLWVYLRDKRFNNPCAVYQFTPTRNKDGPLAWLEKFKGHLQADEYPGYEGLYAGGDIIPVSCWSHARRKFTDLEKAGHSPIARLAILRIGELFAIERRLNEAKVDFEKRLAVRQQEAIPKLNALKHWLDEQLLGLSQKSDLAKAIAYLTKRWECFTRYTQDGRLLMHNNPAENALRSVVLGRKNYLFAGSDQGGERAAVFYSLIETCKLNGINPYTYLTDVLSRLPTHPANRIEELIPYNWKSAQEPRIPQPNCAG
jgi:transposase